MKKLKNSSQLLMSLNSEYYTRKHGLGFVIGLDKTKTLISRPRPRSLRPRPRAWLKLAHKTKTFKNKLECTRDKDLGLEDSKSGYGGVLPELTPLQIGNSFNYQQRKELNVTIQALGGASVNLCYILCTHAYMLVYYY